MRGAVALQRQRAGRKEVLRVVVAYQRKRPVLSLLGGLFRNRQGHLYVGVPLVGSACDGVDLQLAYLHDVHAVVPGPQVRVDRVLE